MFKNIPVLVKLETRKGNGFQMALCFLRVVSYRHTLTGKSVIKQRAIWLLEDKTTKFFVM